MRSLLRWTCFGVIAAGLVGVAVADDLLGGGKGNGGGSTTVGSGGGSGGSSGGSNSGGGPVRDRDRDQNGSTRGGSPIVVESTSTGRSGRNTQRGSNNRVRAQRDPIIVDSVGGGRSSIRDQAYEQDRAYSNRWRDGYYQYNDRWDDSRWCYPFYTYQWNDRYSVVSPWYWYSNMPGYISVNRVQWGDFGCQIRDWSDYDYRESWRGSRRDWDYAIHEAIDDLRAAFLRQDTRRLSDLVPRRAWIFIQSADERDYRVRSDDFYDLMVDLIRSTRTRSFTVLDVEHYRSDTIRLTAEHRYIDAWSRERRTYMVFLLERDRNGYFDIYEFGTSNRRPL